ncbi:MAG: ATP-dependent helicase, partial [Chitinivibrionales bacterium]|nr:ATP-dependent helicase [Chitinivibrionales bacterium]
ERRLFYVGMTRAQKRLLLSYPQNKILRKKIVPVTPCRFIREIPQEYLDGKFGEKQDTDYDVFAENLFSEMRKKFAAPTEQSTPE